jgi:broad specificity phosphatase PhoE
VQPHPRARELTVLIIVRHGQTAPNAAGLLLGRRSDPPLTDLGRRQAEAMGRVLAGAARVVSSPLQRARDTAAYISTEFEVDERWAEIDYGELEGVPLADVPADLWAQWRADVAFAPASGESLAAVGARVSSACTDLAAAARTQDVVVVTHVSPIKAAVAWALATGDHVAWRLFVAVASVTRIAVTDRGTALHSFNETHHLPL